MIPRELLKNTRQSWTDEPPRVRVRRISQRLQGPGHELRQSAL